MVWLDITGQLYVLLPNFWAVMGTFSFILLAGFRPTVMLIFLTPPRSGEGVRGTLPNCGMWGKGGGGGQEAATGQWRKQVSQNCPLAVNKMANAVVRSGDSAHL